MKLVIPAASKGVTKDGETNDCVVRAISNVTGMNYDDVHAVLKKHGRKDRCGTYYPTSVKAMKELGFKGVAMAYNWWHYNLDEQSEPEGRKTLNQVVKDLPMGKYVVYIKGHATALINGQIVDTFDQSKSKPVMVIWYHPQLSYA